MPAIETKHHVPDDITINAHRLAMILEDGLRGRSVIRIARERSIAELTVTALLKAHGHPMAKPMREAVAQLLALPADTKVTVELNRPPTPAAAPRPTAPTRPVAPSPDAGATGWAADPRPDAGARMVTALVSDIHPDPDNPREHLEDIEGLAESIRSAGLVQPIVVRRHEGRLVVVAGHRRLAAVQHLGRQSVDVIIRADMRPDDVLAAMLIENGQRTDLDPVEEARALRRLKAQMGEVSDAALAARVGRTQVHVSNRLAILSLPVDEQEMLRAGQMNLGDAVRRGRIASGKVRGTNTTGHPHLGIEHSLSHLARARCVRLKHRSKGRNSVGGVACGECWESVIRADERDQAHKHSAQLGHCVTCGTEQQAAMA